MARTAKGHTVYWKRGWAYVRFTYAATTYRIALGTSDPGEAATRAAREYSDVVSGRKVATRHAPSLLALDELLATWLDESKGALDPRTLETYEIYARKFVAFFRTTDRLTEATIGDYTRARLRQVLASTVRKERSGLSSFLTWCREQGYLATVPTFPELPKKATGVRSGRQRSQPVDITEAQARAILDRLPELSKTIGGRRWPVRARFLVAWETALRPETLATLSVPEHYQRGARVLRVAGENDKSRYGRDVPLSDGARRALDSVVPESGLVFGRHQFAKVLKRAATSVLGPELGRSFSAYDLRHGRAMDLLDRSGSLSGVAYVLGHKRLSTTDRYLRGRFSEAAAVVSGTIPVPGRRGDTKTRVTDGD